MIKYLDPKNDLTFRKIFGEHPHLLISFLNSMLPLLENQLIVTIEYQDIELIPELPEFKRSMVDVRCTDNYGRQFIVEMQMYWTSSFRKRMLFNVGKAYVKQLKKKEKFKILQPVYGLCLIDDLFTTSENLKNIYYHHYGMVHAMDSKERIEGLELIFVELPKFTPQNLVDKKLRTLWLRFLTEIDEDTENVSEDLKNQELINEALECVQKDAFTPQELEYYDKYWDSIRIEKEAIEEAIRQKEEAIHQKEEAMIQKEEAIRQKEEAEAKAKDAELKAEAKAKDAELKAEAKAKEAELKAEAKAKEAELKAEAKIEIEKQKIINMVLKRHKKGMSVLEIVEDLGVSEKEIIEIVENKIKN